MTPPKRLPAELLAAALKEAVQPRLDHGARLVDEVAQLRARRDAIDRALLERLPALERYRRALDATIGALRILMEIESDAATH